MDTKQALKALADVTAYQWGLITTAQASKLGVSRMQLSRLTQDELVERLGHGIYRDLGAPSDHLTSLRAAWISTNPSLTASERLSSSEPDAVVSGASAAYLLGIGDLVPEPYQFTVPRRRQTQRTELVFRTRALPDTSITIRDGLPVTTVEQTIADLFEAGGDSSLVADALRDAPGVDKPHLASLLSPLAHSAGHQRNDGTALLQELEHMAGIDTASMVKQLAARIEREGRAATRGNPRPTTGR